MELLVGNMLQWDLGGYYPIWQTWFLLTGNIEM